ncbi:hypothetical protein H4Q26_011923 [Puccinia striiformis f. sp. tritici PST-130]|uniref:DUF7872 domain-containing protein n=1 Tax=Puccinia striiformis f. sp. tritici PST-78 TaxID=1165861 RepID=A0A0L0UT04_9BASI|nr:hypothetical protein H4Q26_011923 [Puccinia striiformis f. sp. tritici PST-130]KNE90183.1 hypothetical protein PSTG_16367 [Puccinia striiformis f. sp. tritici PST-78]
MTASKSRHSRNDQSRPASASGASHFAACGQYAPAQMPDQPGVQPTDASRWPSQGPSAPMVLMNIVLARGDKVENTIYNAQTIGMKYSISAEYLTTSAWKCQTKQFLGILKKHSRNLSELNRARGKEPRGGSPTWGDDLVEFGARHPFSIGLAPTRVLPGCEPANEARRGLLSPIGARGPFHSARGERFGGPIGSASSAINGGGTAPTKTIITLHSVDAAAMVPFQKAYPMNNWEMGVAMAAKAVGSARQVPRSLALVELPGGIHRENLVLS